MVIINHILNGMILKVLPFFLSFCRKFPMADPPKQRKNNPSFFLDFEEKTRDTLFSMGSTDQLGKHIPDSTFGEFIYIYSAVFLMDVLV